MKTMNKVGLMMLALLFALCLTMSALAEGTTESAVTTTAVEEAQAKANALNEALTAYGNAKADSRKQARLDSLKQELDGYVAAGKLTQEQADLIYEYYVEQLTLQQNGAGYGHGGKGGRNGQNKRDNKDMNQNGFGKGGRQGRFQNGQTNQDAVTSATQTQPAGI